LNVNPAQPLLDPLNDVNVITLSTVPTACKRPGLQANHTLLANANSKPGWIVNTTPPATVTEPNTTYR
jgi:hypothetical protein